MVNARDNDIFAESMVDLEEKDIRSPLIASERVRRWHSGYIGGVSLFDFAGFSQRMMKQMGCVDWQMIQMFAAGAQYTPKMPSLLGRLQSSTPPVSGDGRE